MDERKEALEALNGLIESMEAEGMSVVDPDMVAEDLKRVKGLLEKDMKPTIKQWLGFTDEYKKQSLNTPGLLDDVSTALQRLIEIDEQPWRYCDKCKGEPDKLAHKMSCLFAKHGGICCCPVSEDARKRLEMMFDGTLKKCLENNAEFIRENEAQKIEISLLESKIRELEADNAGLAARLEVAELNEAQSRKLVEEGEQGIAKLSTDYGNLLNQFNDQQRELHALKDAHDALKIAYSRSDAHRANLEKLNGQLESERGALRLELTAKNRNWSVEDEIQERLLANWHCSQCKSGVCSAHKPVTLEEFMRLVMRDEARISKDARDNNSGNEQQRQFVQSLGFESLRLLLNRWRTLNQR